MVVKPKDIAADKFKSAKWDEITAGRDFGAADIPNLRQLCLWYSIQDRCERSLTETGELEILFENKVGDLKERPEIGTLKKATDTIRALNKQLHIQDEAEGTPSKPAEKPATPLKLIQGKYKHGGRVANA